MARSYSVYKRMISDRLGKAAGVITDASLLEALNGTLDDLRNYVDFPEAKKTALLSPALFSDVTVYTPPSDLYTDRIIAMRPFTDLPAVRRDISLERNTGTEFDRNLRWEQWKGKFAIEYNQGVKTLRLLGRPNSKAQNVLIHACEGYNTDGTWVADTSGSDATNVASNQITFMEGAASVSFDVDVSQSVQNFARIYVPDMNVKDVSLVTQGYLFVYVNIPTATYVTSIDIIYGSDTGATPGTKANYYTFNATTQFGGAAFVSGKNLIGVPLSLATQTGTVTTTALRYVEAKLNYSASQADMSGVIIDGIYLRDGELSELQYYTQNVVQAATGTYKQYFTLTDDVTIFQPDTEMLFIDWAAQRLAPNAKMLGSTKTMRDLAADTLKMYMANHPHEIPKVKKNWYYT